MPKIPPLSSRELIKVLQKVGFKITRQKGSHVIIMDERRIRVGYRPPTFVGETLETVASALNGIDEKLGGLTERFGVFGEYAKRMDDKLTGIDEKLDKIATLPEKVDTLPERIAEAISSSKKK